MQSPIFKKKNLRGSLSLLWRAQNLSNRRKINMQMKELQRIREETVLAVEKAAIFIQHEIGKIHKEDIISKALNSLVTYVDKEAEKLLVNELKRILPEATFLTEENTIEEVAGEWQWII